jgi:hypothetical protein
MYHHMLEQMVLNDIFGEHQNKWNDKLIIIQERENDYGINEFFGKLESIGFVDKYWTRMIHIDCLLMRAVFK